MHIWWYKIIALFISFGVVFSSLPLSHLHDHSELECIDHTETKDACHMQIYHGYVSADINCNHKTHVFTEIKKCGWCKFVKPFRDNYTTLDCTNFMQFNILTEFSSEYILINYPSFAFYHQGRAPPPTS